jgi:hypothetical protein
MSAEEKKDFDQYDISFDDFHVNVTQFLKKPSGKNVDGYEKEFEVSFHFLKFSIF